MRRDGKNTYSQQCRLLESVFWRCLDPAILHIVTVRCDDMPCLIPFLSKLQPVDCILLCSSKRLVFIGLDLLTAHGATKFLNNFSLPSWLKYWYLVYTSPWNYRDCTVPDLPNSGASYASSSYALLRYELQLCP